MGSYRRTLAAATATILASISLYPIFHGMAWFWDGVGAVCTVMIAGTLTRLRRLPLVACLAGVLAGLVLFLNAAFESASSRYLVVPTWTSLRALWDLAGVGFNESAKYAPQVPELSGMLLLAAAGIGLTALLTDFIAVRLESAALAGLPLLLLFTEPFTLSLSRSGVGTIITFGLGTAGYLALLSSEGRDRIKEWERPDPSPEQLPDTRALTAAGRRVGIAAVALALCVPVFVPGLHATRLFGGQPGIGGTPGPGGAGGVGFPDPNLQLSEELHQAQPSEEFAYSSSDVAPQYFQIYVLDNLTDSGWHLFSQPESLVSVSPRLQAPGLTQSSGVTTAHTAVTLSRSVGQDDLSALPVPYPATSVTAPGKLQADKNSLMIFDSGEQLAGLSYSVTSLDEAPSAQLLNQTPAPNSDIVQHYTEVPKSYQSLRSLAESIVKSYKATTMFQKALALQEWFTNGNFTYTLNAPTILSARALTSFLAAKKGYCQQFSFAMAVLARLLGIPSRVAYGFTAGTSTGSNTWVVTTEDAHAWPELYFQGYGWLRFEPTPGGGPGEGTATSPSYTLQPADAFAPGSTEAFPSTAPTSSANARAVPPGVRAGLLPPGGISGGLTTPNLPNRMSLWDIVGLVVAGLVGLLLLVSVAPSCARLVIRRRRWRSGARGGDGGLAHAAWLELRDDLVDYRAGYQPSESPRALAARVGPGLELTGSAVAALRRITMAEERARYAGRPDSGVGLHEDSATVRRAISAAVPRRTRWLARLMPSSVVTPALIRVSQVADVLGRLGPEMPGGARLRRTSRREQPTADGPADVDGTSRSEPPVGAGVR